MRKFWPFMVNFFGYATMATFVPLLVLYYQDIGFTGTQIGIMVGITPLITIIASPFWTNLADRTRRHKLIWGSLFLMAISILLLFPQFKTFAFVFIFLTLFNLVFAPFVSFIDTATMHMLGDEKEMYGRVRLGGTFGFGISAAVAGSLVERYGMSYAFYVGALLLLLAFLFSRKLEFGAPLKVDETEQKMSILDLFREPRWQALFAISLANGIGFSGTATYFYPYMAGLGAQESLMGISVFVGTMSEIPILFYGNKFFKFFKPFTLLVLATAITGARLIMFGLNTSPNFTLVIQLLNGLTFVLMWMAGVAYADKYAPKNMKATVQGLMGAMNFGVGSALGGFIGGLLLVRIGANSLFLIYGVFILIITAGASIRERQQVEISPAGAAE